MNDDQVLAMSKLKTIKEIRERTIGVEKLRIRLLTDLEMMEKEDGCVIEYKKEIDHLQQERMAHVEELRQIHADISTMENVMKQADESRRTYHENVKKIMHEYYTLKHNVDTLRHQELGMEKLPEICATDLERFKKMGIRDSLLTSNRRTVAKTGDKCAKSSFSSDVWLMRAVNASHSSIVCGKSGQNGSDNSCEKNGESEMSTQERSCSLLKHSQHKFNDFQIDGNKTTEVHNTLMKNVINAQTSTSALSVSNPSSIVPANFRQQPPPMKSCLSCHQQIHRNAPICPLCKAKSRSRNPKKPKKKEVNG